MKKILAVLVMALLFSPTFSLAQTRPPEDAKQFSENFDAYIRTVMERIPDIPGLAVVVVKDDKPVFVKAYGMADREARRKADANTMWYIASSTKAFTALAAAMLDREGKIKFADPVTRYAKGVTFKNQIPDKVTVRDLLTHTSGLRNGILVNRLAFTGQVEPAAIDRVFAEATTFNEADFGKYNYTNLGYNIYGLLVQHSLNTKWQDLLQKRVFDPAGMKQTTARISIAPARKWSVAAPYYLDYAQDKVVRSPLNKTDENMQSAGGMFMSITDLGKWINLNMNDGRLNGKQVFPAELMREVHTGYTKSTRNEPPFAGDGEYGLGWQIGRYKDEKVIYHHGGFAGYRSHVSFLPDKKIGVGVLVNNDLVGGRMADVIATYAYDWWLRSAGLEANYAKLLQETIDTYQRRRQQAHAGALERAKRTWQLSRPRADYAGKYTNDLQGTIVIAPTGDSFEVRMGNIYTVATPFTEKDSIRVEMVPGGNGEVIRFKLKDERVESINYAGADFKRLP